MTKKLLRESEIKARVLSRLRSCGIISPKTIVANEFPLGRSAVRADLALLGNDFIGIEIKSKNDSLRRLVRQISGYKMYFDKVILVVASKHLGSISPDLLSGIELWELSEFGDLVPLIADQFVDRSGLEPLTTLMTQRDLEKFARANAGGSQDSPSNARVAFSAAFKMRFGRTSKAFWEQVGRRQIKADDLACLSRFRERRLLETQIAEQREGRWAQWSTEGWRWPEEA